MDRYEIIWRSIQKNGYKYDYREVTTTNSFKDNLEKQTLICPIHGRFKVNLIYHFYLGYGCEKCKEKKFALTDKHRKDILYLIYGNKFDFSNSIFKDADTETNIICNNCGNAFKSSYHSLIKYRKYTCLRCYHNQQKINNKIDINNIEDKIIKQIDKNIFYDNYDLSEYIDTHSLIKIHCIKHGWFAITYKNFIHNHGCYKCGIENQKAKRTMQFNEFLEKAKSIYGDMFYYFKETYTKLHSNVKMRCNNCGYIFERNANSHLRCFSLCQNCNKRSIMEYEIQKLLEENNIPYLYNNTFDWLIYNRKLTLDFYLPNQKIAIECQGLQHFEPIEFFGGNESFFINRKRDEEKLKLCKKNNVKMIYYSNIKNYDYFLDEIVFHNLNDVLIEIIKR